MPLIRKITIGKEYTVNAMHYSVGQKAYGEHYIVDIEEVVDKYNLYISDKDKKNIKLWKDFNKNMGISCEYFTDY